jgi:N-acetylglucosamine-6-phosphate deacetylase
VAILLRAKGPEHAVLITDATSAAGMPDGRYRLGSFEVEVHGDRCLFAGQLAGSVLTLDRAVRNVMKFARWNLQSALRLATLNPARQLGLAELRPAAGMSGGIGVLAPGSSADVVVLTPAGDVLATFVNGELAYQA